jgi:predicted RNA-binding Zn-ribbon protein involved in translation (DUF1610 family)
MKDSENKNTLEKQIETYKVFVQCVNCNWYGNVEISKGVPTLKHECPNCGCENVLLKTP